MTVPLTVPPDPTERSTKRERKLITRMGNAFPAGASGRPRTTNEDPLHRLCPPLASVGPRLLRATQTGWAVVGTIFLDGRRGRRETAPRSCRLRESNEAISWCRLTLFPLRPLLALCLYVNDCTGSSAVRILAAIAITNDSLFRTKILTAAISFRHLTRVLH